MKYNFILHGKSVTWMVPSFVHYGVFCGAPLCSLVWIHDKYQTQCAETITVEEIGQLMGGN